MNPHARPGTPATRPRSFWRARHRDDTAPLVSGVVMLAAAIATWRWGVAVGLVPLMGAALLVGYVTAARRHRRYADHQLAEVEQIQAALVEQLWRSRGEIEVRDR